MKGEANLAYRERANDAQRERESMYKVKLLHPSLGSAEALYFVSEEEALSWVRLVASEMGEQYKVVKSKSKKVKRPTAVVTYCAQ